MSRIVREHKLPLDHNVTFEVVVPVGFHILGFGITAVNDGPCMWTLANEHAETERRVFAAWPVMPSFSAGAPTSVKVTVPDTWPHVGTWVSKRGQAWHIFLGPRNYDGEKFAPNPNHPLEPPIAQIVEPETLRRIKEGLDAAARDHAQQPKPLVFEGEVKLSAVDNRSFESDDIPCTSTGRVSVFLFGHNDEPGPASERHPELIAFANKRVRVTVEVIDA